MGTCTSVLFAPPRPRDDPLEPNLQKENKKQFPECFVYAVVENKRILNLHDTYADARQYCLDRLNQKKATIINSQSDKENLIFYYISDTNPADHHMLTEIEANVLPTKIDEEGYIIDKQMKQSHYLFVRCMPWASVVAHQHCQSVQ